MTSEVTGSSAAAAALLTATVLAGCIIPDRGILAENDNSNPGAVRIVESVHVPQELLDACSLPLRDPQADLTGCPQVPNALPQGLIGGGPYCSCPGRQQTQLPEFSVYAEDSDRLRDGPADTLYAVALLDLDPLTDAPQNFVAFEEHLRPGGRGEFQPGPVALAASTGREDNGLWQFRFGKDGGRGTDLCNDDNGQTLPLGLHNLQIMVTDRPFFEPTRVDENGDPVLGPDGRPLLLGTQWGMPDLGIGATWGVANYVFSCVDPLENAGCDCIEEAP